MLTLTLANKKHTSTANRGDISLQTPQPTINKTQEEILLEPFRYLCSHPGKDIRSKMIEAFDYWIKVPKPALDVITRIIEMLHSASLLIDDVEDGSILRRGYPVAHHVYGIPQTINCANYVYFLALAELNKLNNINMVNIYTDELVNLHKGQGMELFWRDSLLCPSESEFIEMVNNKTGGLLRLAVKLMQEAGHSKRDYIPLVENIGIHFQVRDDYMNLQSTAYTDNKGFCEDLTEGKFSFPIIHSILADPKNHQLINILRKKSSCIELKKFAVELIEKTGSFNYSLAYMSKMEKGILQEIEELGGNPILEKIMSMLHVEKEQDSA
ncbi:geranylgeranyl pyrophosphate synthase [Spinellus fusiger]|nr:geranylgeranyl pyrophosphate synthase [Spinellus fusiger]